MAFGFQNFRQLKLCRMETKKEREMFHGERNLFQGSYKGTCSQLGQYSIMRTFKYTLDDPLYRHLLPYLCTDALRSSFSSTDRRHRSVHCLHRGHFVMLLCHHVAVNVFDRVEVRIAQVWNLEI